MTFDGDSPFVLVEQTAAFGNDEIISVDGNPYLLASGVASVSENMVSWIYGGVEYYVVSNNMSEEELLSVASSMAVIPASK